VIEKGGKSEGMWEEEKVERGRGKGKGKRSDIPHSSELWRLSALGEAAGFESVAPSMAG
jgi:hypothetical protein